MVPPPERPLGSTFSAMADAPASPTKLVTPKLAELGDRFIPIRIEAIVDAIDADPDRFGELAGWAQKICKATERVIAQEVGELHRHLDRLYAAANPDLDALAEPNPLVSFADPRLHAALDYLFDRASFTPLTDVGIEAAIRAGSAYGLRVRINPDRIRSLALHVRGRGTITLVRRDKKKPWIKIEREIEIYTRLAVVARLTGEECLRLKLFRDIPVADVEALLPHAEATMTVLDRAMIVGMGAGSLGSLAKVAVVGAASTSALAIPAAIGFGGMAVRSFFGYKRKKKQRTSHRTEHLYEKNLANNAAVLHTLCRMIAHEEAKAAIIAYAVLAARHDLPEQDRWPLDELAARASAYLKERFKITSRFDAGIARATLERLGLMEDAALADPDVALETVDGHWTTRDTTGFHLKAIEQRLAGDQHGG